LAADCYSYIKAERDRDEVIQFMWGAFDIDTMVHVYMSKREILPGTIYLSNIEIILLEES